MPCLEPTYLTRAAMHAFTTPDTPAKRGKLLATVAGRDLPVQQLQHSGHRKSVVHCNSAILNRVCQFNLSLPERTGRQASHYWKRKLLHRAPTTHVVFIVGGIKQVDFIIERGGEQIFIVINHQPDITDFKNTTVTKTAIKQASALNETSTEPVTCIRAASKQGSSIIRKGKASKNVSSRGLQAPQRSWHTTHG